eukprot:Skav201342  [mRNA]  locus=scaffold1389:347636:350773:+ [translate_table: standard]
MLAKEIKKEASRARLTVETKSLDKKTSRDVDLSDVELFQKILNEVKEHQWDGFHSGFPCSSFSRVRWRDHPHGPPPVRSGEHIYGLPGNTPQQQAEADRGTLMATRSAILHKEQVVSARDRGVPEVTTLENPPGTDEHGSAWAILEIKEIVKETGSAEVEFNTCAYQTKLRDRWFKPSKWVGKLEGLTKLAKICRCPNWARHVPVVGKNQTEKAGAYPEELAKEVAVMVVNSWKRTVSLEWWRHMMQVKSQEVNHLQRLWLQNEEKRRKRLFEDTVPKAQLAISNPTKKMRTGIGVGALEIKDSETAELTSSSARPSKREKRQLENEFFLGGMRNPASAVARLHLVRKAGKDIAEKWEVFRNQNPEAVKVARDYGTKQAKFDDEVLGRWRREFHELLEAKEPEGVHLRTSAEFKSPLNADLWDAWSATSRDPENHIGQWAREGVPMGMEVQIPRSNQIFPPVEVQETLDDRMDMVSMATLKNYESVESQVEEAAIEVDRYIDCGFCKVVPLETVYQTYPKGAASRLALILKQKTDGSTKRRIVIDLKRSDGNKRCQVPERIVLPRAGDILTSIRVMNDREIELLKPGQTLQSLPREDREVEFFLLDLKDAFCHFGVNEAELCHCVSPGLENGTAIIWCAMLFGFKASPYIMGRLSAAIGRGVQALMHPAEGQCQVYVDDVALMIRGNVQHREAILAMVLYTLAAFGIQLSLDKGERGHRITWIGTTFQLDYKHLILGTPQAMVDDIKVALGKWINAGMIPTKELRSIVGKLAWVAGIVPRLRWCVTTLYAVLASAEKDEAKEPSRALKREGDQRPKVGLVHTKRMGSTLHWLNAAFAEPDKFLIRIEDIHVKPVEWAVITDACPKGLGGVIAQKSAGEWKIMEAFEAKVLPADASRLNIEYRKPSGQAVLEGLAILRALQVWSTKLKAKRILIRSDSSVALAMVHKLASPHPTLNYLASEIALLMENIAVPSLIPQHLAGKWNDEADWLSRLGDRPEMPKSLEGIKIQRVMAFEAGKCATDPPNMPTSPWREGDPHPQGVFDSLG